MSQLGVMDEGKIVSQVGAKHRPATFFLVDKRIAFGFSTYPLAHVCAPSASHARKIFWPLDFLYHPSSVGYPVRSKLKKFLQIRVLRIKLPLGVIFKISFCENSSAKIRMQKVCGKIRFAKIRMRKIIEPFWTTLCASHLLDEF